MTAVTVEAYVVSNQLPENHARLVALLEAKLGYWTAYHSYLARLIEQTRSLAARVEAQID